MVHLTVSGAARELSTRLGIAVKPHEISDLLYSRVLDDSQFPIIAGRRLIRIDQLPLIEKALVDRGILSRRGEEAQAHAS